jgi:hypothetical protein
MQGRHTKGTSLSGHPLGTKCSVCIVNELKDELEVTSICVQHVSDMYCAVNTSLCGVFTGLPHLENKLLVEEQKRSANYS